MMRLPIEQHLGSAMRKDAASRVRLGEFELDVRTGELCPTGSENERPKILLRQQPFDVLRLLIEANGEIVTRQEIKKRLWPNNTIVNFDHSINVVIGILRRAVRDSADVPQYIETVARRGYRLRYLSNGWKQKQTPICQRHRYHHRLWGMPV
jgi:eukaryotic-like serine/threonine-protein kinase